MEGKDTMPGFGGLPEDEEGRDTIPDFKYQQEQDPGKTIAGFEKAPEADESAPIPQDMNKRMMGVDIRQEMLKKVREEEAAGNVAEAEKFRKFIEQMDTERAKERKPAPIPRSTEPKPERKAQFHKTENPVQFFGPEVQEQIKAEMAKKEKEKRKKKGFLGRIFGRK
jgi:hypothetical protein